MDRNAVNQIISLHGWRTQLTMNNASNRPTVTGRRFRTPFV
jgi:hypothetical protein